MKIHVVFPARPWSMMVYNMARILNSHGIIMGDSMEMSALDLSPQKKTVDVSTLNARKCHFENQLKEPLGTFFEVNLLEKNWPFQIPVVPVDPWIRPTSWQLALWQSCGWKKISYTERKIESLWILREITYQLVHSYFFPLYVAELIHLPPPKKLGWSHSSNIQAEIGQLFPGPKNICGVAREQPESQKMLRPLCYHIIGRIHLWHTHDISVVFKSFAGWWFEPLWKILVNWDDYSQYMGK